METNRPLSSSLPSDSKSLSLSLASTSSGTNDSQNALLKQLLQNSGCASIGPTSETNSLSLAECLNQSMSPAIVPTHHLLEAATQIPTPTSSSISKSISSSFNHEIIVKNIDKQGKAEKHLEKEDSTINNEKHSTKSLKSDDKEVLVGHVLQSVNQGDRLELKSSCNLEKIGTKIGKPGIDLPVTSKISMKLQNISENSDSVSKVDKKVTSNEAKLESGDGKAGRKNDIKSEATIKLETAGNNIKRLCQEQLSNATSNVMCVTSVAGDVNKGITLTETSKNQLKTNFQGGISPKISSPNLTGGPGSPLPNKAGPSNFAAPLPLPLSTLISGIKEERKDTENSLPEINFSSK